MTVLTGAGPDEIRRERARLSQIRHRKRKKALEEGKSEDFYITDQDFYQDQASFDPPKRPTARAESAKKSDTARPEPESVPEPLLSAKNIFYIALFILAFIVYVIFQHAKELYPDERVF